MEDESTAIGPDKDLERVKRLADDLRHVQQSWGNRLILENCPLWEGYFDGKFEFALYGKAFEWGVDEFYWLVRAPGNGKVLDRVCPNSDTLSIDLRDANNGNEVVMFVVVAQAGGGPKVQIHIPARFYFFRNKVRRVGEGLLYRGEGLGCFKIFPFFREGKMEAFSLPDAESSRVHPKVQAFPEVVHSIASDCAKVLRDRFFGGVVEEITIGVGKDRYTSVNHPKVIKPLWEGGLIGNNLVNVAVGPFDL